MQVSFLEIYNENLYDLLAESPGDSHSMAVQEDPVRGAYVSVCSCMSMSMNAGREPGRPVQHGGAGGSREGGVCECGCGVGHVRGCGCGWATYVGVGVEWATYVGVDVGGSCPWVWVWSGSCWARVQACRMWMGGRGSS